MTLLRANNAIVLGSISTLATLLIFAKNIPTCIPPQTPTRLYKTPTDQLYY